MGYGFMSPDVTTAMDAFTMATSRAQRISLLIAITSLGVSLVSLTDSLRVRDNGVAETPSSQQLQQVAGDLKAAKHDIGESLRSVLPANLLAKVLILGPSNDAGTWDCKIIVIGDGMTRYFDGHAATTPKAACTQAVTYLSDAALKKEVTP